MRVNDLLDRLEELERLHGNCYVLIDSDYEGEASVETVEILPYAETEYFVIKA